LLGGTPSHDHDTYLAFDLNTLIDDNAWHEIEIDVKATVGLNANMVGEFEFFTMNNGNAL